MSKQEEQEDSVTSIDGEEDHSLHWMHDIVEYGTIQARKTMRCLAYRELTGDANDGITELTCKALLMQGMMNSPQWDAGYRGAQFKIFSEFEFPGNRRADIVVLAESPDDDAKIDAHIIEVKYFRTGFIAQYNKDRRRFHKNLQVTAKEIDAMTPEELKNVSARTKFTSNTTSKVSDVLASAEEGQCKSYMNLMRMKYGKRLSSVTSQVVFGISRNILIGDLLQ